MWFPFAEGNVNDAGWGWQTRRNLNCPNWNCRKFNCNVSVFLIHYQRLLQQARGRSIQFWMSEFLTSLLTCWVCSGQNKLDSTALEQWVPLEPNILGWMVFPSPDCHKNLWRSASQKNPKNNNHGSVLGVSSRRDSWTGNVCFLCKTDHWWETRDCPSSTKWIKQEATNSAYAEITHG